MKTLYESILDDEDVIVDKAEEENNNRWNFIYSLLKYKEADRCVKRLNDSFNILRKFVLKEVGDVDLLPADRGFVFNPIRISF